LIQSKYNKYIESFINRTLLDNLIIIEECDFKKFTFSSRNCDVTFLSTYKNNKDVIVIGFFDAGIDSNIGILVNGPRKESIIFFKNKYYNLHVCEFAILISLMSILYLKYT
jgi:hypothetical protein